MVRDLSYGGLSVESEHGADQGDSVRVRLEPPGKPPIEIEALVWNVRDGRSRRTGGELHRLGLVLSEAPKEFEKLVSGHTRRAPKTSPRRPAHPRRPARKPAEAPAEQAAPEPSETLPRLPPPEPELEPPPEIELEDVLQRFHARVACRGTSRTRRILVFAASAEEAEEKALVEVGDDWSLLEIIES
jgi:hypothetical protein